MPDGRKRRCFVAINLPEGIKQEIFEKISSKFPATECKPVEKENLHITLAFLGYVEETAVEKAKKEMAFLQEENSFEVQLHGVGDFNNRVYWLGVQEGAAEMEKIARSLQKALPVEDERFSAHLTIARNKTLGREEARKIIAQIEKENYSAGFRVENVDFMESILSGSGPEYRKLFSVPLKG